MVRPPIQADGFVGCEAVEGLEALGEVVGIEEGHEVGLELVMAFVVVSADGGLLEGSVNALDLPVGPGMIGFCEAMLGAVRDADAIQHVHAIASRRP